MIWAGNIKEDPEDPDKLYSKSQIQTLFIDNSGGIRIQQACEMRALDKDGAFTAHDIMDLSQAAAGESHGRFGARGAARSQRLHGRQQGARALASPRPQRDNPSRLTLRAASLLTAMKAEAPAPMEADPAPADDEGAPGTRARGTPAAAVADGQPARQRQRRA